MVMKMQNTERIFNYFEDKYGLGYLGLLKTATVASMLISNSNIIPLSILVISPPGQFKSQTTRELQNIFSQKSIKDLGSDFTIHSIIKISQNGRLFNHKTLLINDLTLLFSSKANRTKDRLVNALAEILSEGVYTYGDRLEAHMIFKAKVNIIANITTSSFYQNKKSFLDNTFIERLMPFHYNLSDNKQEAFSIDETNRKSMIFGNKISLKKLTIENYAAYNDVLLSLAKEYKLLTLSPSLPRCIDKIKALIGGLCILNNQTTITQEIIEHTSLLIKYSGSQGNKDMDIIQLFNQGVSIKEICRTLNYDSDYPYKVIRKYKQNGFLS